jgi:NitT/TauT family transport system substrate-binding protein
VIPRALIACLCSVALFAPLAGAGGAAELTPIKVGILPLEPTAQPMYAKHRGMFRKQGIDAQIRVFADPSQTVPALLSGDVQFVGTHVGGAASLKSRNAPVKVVAAGAIHEPKAPTSAIVAARGKTIRSARDLVGKTIAMDFPNTIGHLGVVELLERNGIEEDDVKFSYMPFAQMLGPLEQGTVDAALLPEPYRTQALQRGMKHVAYPFGAVCSTPCQLTFWLARADVDQNLVARFRNAIQSASVWANQDKNDQLSGKILAKYASIDAKVIAKMTRTTFGTRLRVSLAKQWLPVFAKHGVIPASFKPIDLVK